MSLINGGLKDLKEEIKEIPEEERGNEKLDKIVEIVREILKSNKRIIIVIIKGMHYKKWRQFL